MRYICEKNEMSNSYIKNNGVHYTPTDLSKYIANI